MTFQQVMDRWPWRPIPNCPGRYKLSRSATLPREIVGAALSVERHESVRDPIHVVRVADGGLISYEQADGTFVHTLGDAEGFARKLAELGI